MTESVLIHVLEPSQTEYTIHELHPVHGRHRTKCGIRTDEMHWGLSSHSRAYYTTHVSEEDRLCKRCFHFMSTRRRRAICRLRRTAEDRLRAGDPSAHQI